MLENMALGLLKIILPKNYLPEDDKNE